MRRLLAAGAVAALLQLPVPGAAARPLPGAPSCPMLPADSVWHSDASRLPVHPRSTAWLASMGGPARRLHPDFGPSYGDIPRPYGIPDEVVPANRPKVAVSFDYADESDRVGYPFASTTPIEGGQDAGGDRHALMVDPATCRLYELYAARHSSSGSTAGSGAVYDLRSNALRPSGWTSADAAGLPILPGLLRLDEVRAGHVDHMVRVTASRTDRSFVWPARHQAGHAADRNLPPMGARFRMKAGVDLSRFRADTQVVLRAFKKHGLVLADNGSDWYFGGTSEDGWPEGLLDELKSLDAGMFEAVDASPLMVDPHSGRSRTARPSLPAVWSAGAWRLRAGLGSSGAETTLAYGQAGDVPVTGDWDGNGTRTPGYVRAGVWHLSNSATSGTDSIAPFGYGRGGDVPVVGDWDGDGRDSVGIVRGGVWHLRNSTSGGAASVTPFGYGRAGDLPVTGDWDGDRRDSVGIVRGGVWHLRNSTSGGAASITPFGYGRTGDKPVVGDWDADGRDTPGVVRAGTWLLRDSSSAGAATHPGFAFGAAEDVPLRWA